MRLVRSTCTYICKYNHYANGPWFYINIICGLACVFSKDTGTQRERERNREREGAEGEGDKEAHTHTEVATGCGSVSGWEQPFGFYVFCEILFNF